MLETEEIISVTKIVILFQPQFPTIKLAANDIYSEEMVYTFTNVD